jgi:hypothetical protein
VFLVSREHETLQSTTTITIIITKTKIIIIPNIFLQLAGLGASSDFYRQFAKSQIDYILGDSGRSYVVGFGYNPPTHVHHRARYSVWHPSGWVLWGQVRSKHGKHSAILLYLIGLKKGVAMFSEKNVENKLLSSSETWKWKTEFFNKNGWMWMRK